MAQGRVPPLLETTIRWRGRPTLAWLKQRIREATPYGAPNAAAHIERFMGTLRRECLNHFLFLSEDHLRRTVTAYIAYYNGGRPHQGIEGIPEFGPGSPRAISQRIGAGPIQVHDILLGCHLTPKESDCGTYIPPPLSYSKYPRIWADEVFGEDGGRGSLCHLMDCGV